MQTFLPFPSFQDSAHVLDRQRLGKQRVEAKQILNTLLGRSTGWQNHPAVKMWRGFEPCLCVYGGIVSLEWQERGYKDQQYLWFREQYAEISDGSLAPEPPWLGDEAFHSSHRAALLAKAPEWYEQFNWDEEAKIDYFWPRGETQ